MPPWSPKLKDGTDLKTLVAAGALANARDLRRPALRRLPHVHGPAPRPTRWPANCPSEQQAAAGAQGALPQRHATSRPRAAARTRCCTRSSRAPTARRPGRRRGAARGRPQARHEDAPRASSRRSRKGKPSDAYNAPPYCVQDDSERPPRRPRLAGLGDARLHRQGTRPHAAAPVGPVLRATRSSKPARPAGIQTAAAEAARPVQAASGKRSARKTADDAWVEKLAEIDLRRRPGRRRPTRSPRPWPRGSRRTRSARRSSLAANQLVLRDPGRTAGETSRQAGGQRPRRLGRRPRLRRGQRLAEHRPRQRPAQRGRQPDRRRRTTRPARTAGSCQEPYPRPTHLEKVKTTDPAALLQQTEAAIKAQDQALACAAGRSSYGELGHPARPVFDLLLQVRDQRGRRPARGEVLPHGDARSSRRRGRRSGGGSWSALARVTASEYGKPAPGVDEARRLLA